MRYTIPTKLVGVSFKNTDGTDRQELIRKLSDIKDRKLTIEHEKDNPYDKNSHVVKSEDGVLGHISRLLSEDLVKKISEGEKIVDVKDVKVTGLDKHTVGVNLVIEMEKN